jgi:hypothetical protein
LRASSLASGQTPSNSYSVFIDASSKGAGRRRSSQTQTRYQPASIKPMIAFRDSGLREQ